MAPSDVPVHPRTVGRYLLYGELASGGMASVHFGRLSGPVGFSRTVAIKRLHPHYAKDPEFVSMFLDEARIVSRIRHPNVVPTLDVVATEGEIFIVMEYVAGEALSKLMKTASQSRVPIPPRVAAAIISSVLHGLHAAHQTKDEQGAALCIVHRDVSPQNILVGSDGTSRVLDFGVAKATGRSQTTRDGQVKGKIAYMPPEQLNGGIVSHQADVYAASVVLWEALAGRRLFDGETEAIVLVRAIEGRIDPPSLFNPLLDPATDSVVLRGLARDPADRYVTAREMALAIEQTIGLASPYDVGEWVQAVAGEALARRASSIAEIESASMTAPPPTIGFAGHPVEPPHSQVSSISVSRPAPVSVPPKSRLGVRVVGTLVVLLAVGGLALGGVGLQERLAGGGPAHAGKPNEHAHEVRPMTIIKPPSAAAKANDATAAAPPALPRPARHVSAPARAAAKRPKANPACEPPFTVDPATGRKKYKLECLH